jgi:phospholipid-binding lipoprotein MlaA
MPFGRSFASVFRSLLLAAAVGTALAACATPPSDPIEREIYEEANDPVQPLNEAIFEFNLAVDKGVIRPVAKAYEFVLPELVRDSVRNFIRHLKTPVILANDLLQGEVDRAGKTMGRFMFNSIAGFGGLFDPAGEAGHEFHAEDFGQTLAVWGVEEGPYLMLPFLGPSSTRDLAGYIVDTALDPLQWWSYNSDRFIIENQGILRSGLEVVDTRSRNYRQLEDLEETSLDFYATVRSLYRQQRESLIRNGASDDESIPDMSFGDEDGMDDADAGGAQLGAAE